MDDPHFVCGLHGIGDLPHDVRDLVWREWRIPLGIPLEQVAGRPFGCQEVQPRSRFADLDRPYDIGVRYSRPVGRLAHEARDGSAIVSQLLAQHLHGDGAVFWMFGAIDDCRPPFTHHIVKSVPGERRPGEIFSAHGAKVIVARGASKRCALPTPGGSRCVRGGDTKCITRHAIGAATARGPAWDS